MYEYDYSSTEKLMKNFAFDIKTQFKCIDHTITCRV